MTDEPKHPVHTTRKSLHLIEALKRKGEAGVSELAADLDASKSTVHNHLNTLVAEGYAIKEGERYRLGLKFLEVGGHIRKEMELYEVAEPEIEQLAEQSGELANLVVEEHGQVVYLTRSKGTRAVDVDTYAGMRTSMHSTALGKALLAHKPREEVEAIVETHGLPGITENTITTEEELFSCLETVRERGFARDHEERLEGLRCVAAPVTSEDDHVLGAVSVSAPTSRMTGAVFDEEVPELVSSAANVIELNVKYS